MINGSNSCYSNVQPGLIPTCTISEGMVSSTYEESSALETQTNSFLCNLSLLKEKVHQVQSLASIFMCEDGSQNPHEYSKAIAMPAMSSLIQEIIVNASSLMFTCQQMTLGTSSIKNNTNSLQQEHAELAYEYNSHAVQLGEDSQQGFCSKESLDRYGHDYYNFETHRQTSSADRVLPQIKRSEPVTVKANQYTPQDHGNDFPTGEETQEVPQEPSPNHNNIFELDAADLLAKYTHYCQVCGKGFKRDANLRMHMRAHGDEYKSNAALSNPMKNSYQHGQNDFSSKLPTKYSCPQEGCRWNKKHEKFQPLKSMICVKNHYKRSHCPKMYVCKRCNRKQFSLLSDLKTHEKHCGDSKWLCSCGTTFSRKDKLMGHVALFIGHTPMVTNSLTMNRKNGQNSGQIQLEER